MVRMIDCHFCAQTTVWQGDIWDADDGYKFVCRKCANTQKSKDREENLDYLVKHAHDVMSYKEMVDLVDGH